MGTKFKDFLVQPQGYEDGDKDCFLSYSSVTDLIELKQEDNYIIISPEQLDIIIEKLNNI